MKQRTVTKGDGACRSLAGGKAAGLVSKPVKELGWLVLGMVLSLFCQMDGCVAFSSRTGGDVNGEPVYRY